jgi:CDP-glycerol glycerophosphotransferase
VRLQNIIEAILRPLLFVAYWLSGLAPRDPRRWVFGSWDGQRFSDNSAALFRYTARRREHGVDPVWISHDGAIVRQLRAQGLRAHGAWSPGGIYACLTAGVYVYSGLTKDVNHWLSRGAHRVLLRHGVGVKKIERAIDNPSHHLFKLFHGNPLERLAWTFLLPWHAVRPDLAMATSPEHGRQGEAFFGIGPSAIAVTGFPRNDELLAGVRPALPAELCHAIQAARDAGRPVFLYLPTFRDDAARLAFRWADLDAAAGKAGVLLVVKLHFVDARRGLDCDAHDLHNLLLADPALDPNSAFHAVDGLVSDFSSVVYDFMLTGKPVVFYVPDYEQYLRSRSLYFDFQDVTPGSKARNLDELARALADTAREGLGPWAAQYEQVLNRFHSFRDAGASERVYREIVRRFLPDGAARP